MENTPASPVEIAIELLSAEAAEALIDAFIMREGTDYGTNEVSHETKRSQVLRQLENGRIKIVYDPDTESTTLLTLDEWRRLQASLPATSPSP